MAGIVAPRLALPGCENWTIKPRTAVPAGTAGRVRDVRGRSGWDRSREKLPGQERRVPAGRNDTGVARRGPRRAMWPIPEPVVSVAACDDRGSLGRAAIVDHVGAAESGSPFVARPEIVSCGSGERGRGRLCRLADVCGAPRDRDHGGHDCGGHPDGREKGAGARRLLDLARRSGHLMPPCALSPTVEPVVAGGRSTSGSSIRRAPLPSGRRPARKLVGALKQSPHRGRRLTAPDPIRWPMLATVHDATVFNEVWTTAGLTTPPSPPVSPTTSMGRSRSSSSPTRTACSRSPSGRAVIVTTRRSWSRTRSYAPIAHSASGLTLASASSASAGG